jgi:hypothetical protein
MTDAPVGSGSEQMASGPPSALIGSNRASYLDHKRLKSQSGFISTVNFASARQK